MSAKKLLIIGLVWPEPTSSAAGTRMVQLIDLFLSKNYEITFASAASKSDYSYDFSQTNVQEQQIKLNDDRFNSFLKDLNPTIVLFDRFMVEEQYGWRVQQECPDALRILDTEDLHFLRHARHQSAKKQETINLFNDVAKREMAAILRCDLSLIISVHELAILQQEFKIDSSLLYYLPFLEKEITPQTVKTWVSFTERADFAFIGNFLHEPNWNTVQVLKTQIWPMLKTKLPQANLNIYGAYASQKVLQLHNKQDRFFVKGRAENARGTLAMHKILLAPIPFGAGVKGKFIDAMQVGTPSVTTTIGAEAMKGTFKWSGAVTDDTENFIEEAATLYQDQSAWLSAQQNGIKIINELYANPHFAENFISIIENTDLAEHRQRNFIGQILNHHTVQSTKYMSLWIQEKNKESR